MPFYVCVETSKTSITDSKSSGDTSPSPLTNPGLVDSDNVWCFWVSLSRTEGNEDAKWDFGWVIGPCWPWAHLETPWRGMHCKGRKDSPITLWMGPVGTWPGTGGETGRAEGKWKLVLESWWRLGWAASPESPQLRKQVKSKRTQGEKA